MATINIKTKFDIGDSVFGFVDEEIHNLVIDRIEISVEKFGKDNPTQRNRIVYLATTTDAEFNIQHRIKNEALFTEEELKEHINKYFDNYGNK
jgi:hypothetical protein